MMSPSLGGMSIPMIDMPIAAPAPSTAALPTPTPGSLTSPGGTSAASTQQDGLVQDTSASQHSPPSSVSSLPGQDEENAGSSEAVYQGRPLTRLEQIWKLVQPCVSTLGKITTWIWGFMAVIALVITNWSYELAVWTADKDFRAACLAEQERHAFLSAECAQAIQESLRAPPMSKWRISQRYISDNTPIWDATLAVHRFKWSALADSISMLLFDRDRPIASALDVPTLLFWFKVYEVFAPEESPTKRQYFGEGHHLSGLELPGSEGPMLLRTGVVYALTVLGIAVPARWAFPLRRGSLFWNVPRTTFYNDFVWDDPVDACIVVVGLLAATLTLARELPSRPRSSWSEICPAVLLMLAPISATARLVVHCFVRLVPPFGQNERENTRMNMVPKLYYWLVTLMVLTILAVRGPLILYKPKWSTFKRLLPGQL